MRRQWIAVTAVALGAAWIGLTSAGCPGPAACPPVECNVEGMEDLADEALACASRAVDGGNGVAYWLLPLSPVVASETGVLQYVLLAANTSEAPTAAMLAVATGEWFLEPDDGAPVSIKTLAVNVAPNIEVGPGQTEFYIGTLLLADAPQLSSSRWVNLRLELQDNGRTATLRLRLPIRAESDEELNADCWRAISAHRERPVRKWAARVTTDMLRSRAED
ncbi:MAG: hypothetical protein HY907_11775 [Deltaproteobacteria bacterium]|nr:hypothetical protein [Deltaproteobacteria bacterium]